MQKTYPELYKLDSKGKTRVWFMEQDGDKFRTHDGILGGTVKASGWKTAKPTNVGRSNERNGVEQATFEIEARYTKQQKGYYYDSEADIHLGCRYVDPMLADKYKEFQVGEIQPKLDGFRCIINKDGPQSREGELLPGGRHIHRMLVERGIFERFPTLVLDGELYNHDYREDFGGLSSLLRKENVTDEQQAKIEGVVQLHAYDIFLLTPYPFKDVTPKTRQERCAQLGAIIRLIDDPLVQQVPSYMAQTEGYYDQMHGSFVEDGFEGSMWRDPFSLYERGERSKGLLKRKDFDEEEFTIVRIEEGEGNWAGAAKRVVCWLPGADQTEEPTDKNTFEAGLRGKYDANAKLLAERDEHKVVSIRYFGFTTSEIPKPRFGVATKFWGAERTL